MAKSTDSMSSAARKVGSAVDDARGEGARRAYRRIKHDEKFDATAAFDLYVEAFVAGARFAMAVPGTARLPTHDGRRSKRTRATSTR
jgi:hypothetical protein